MIYLWILCGAAALLLLAVFLCFWLTFYVRRTKFDPDVYPLPAGKTYEPYHPQMLEGMKAFRTMPHQVFTIKSEDGLILSGRYFEYAPGAPMELMFHGYRGTAERDLGAGIERAFALGHNALIVDQRTTGGSGGRLVTFGIREHRDCLKWVEFCEAHFGPEIDLYLTGISMGASTVLMAAGEPLPPNVKGVLADCGFTSASAIIKSVCHMLHLPGNLIYPMVRLGGRLFGGFDLEAYSALEAVKKCRIPVIFFHGESDNFVPCYMSRENYEACAAPKAILIVPGAGHGLSYLAGPETYLKTLRCFWYPETRENFSEVSGDFCKS